MLESRVLSDARVRELLEQFVVVKSDPRASGTDPATLRYKVSRFVPEVVLLSPGGQVLGLMQGRDVREVVAELGAVLKGVRG